MLWGACEAEGGGRRDVAGEDLGGRRRTRGAQRTAQGEECPARYRGWYLRLEDLEYEYLDVGGVNLASWRDVCRVTMSSRDVVRID